MKKLMSLFFIWFFLVLAVGNAEIITDKQQIDSVFTELKTNDAMKTEAVFTMKNPSKEMLTKDKLTFSFNEVCGKVRDYKVLAWGNCEKVRKIDEEYDYCYVDENTTKTVCVPSIRKVNEIYYEYDYCDFAFIPTTALDYKIDANLELSLCEDGSYGYKIDWIPSLKVDTNIYIVNKWAWWNNSQLKCKNITINNIPNKHISDYSQLIVVDKVASMQSDYDDVIFVNESCGKDGSMLYFELADYTANNATFWIAPPNNNLSSSGMNISMYYHNDGASSSEDSALTWSPSYRVVGHMGNTSGYLEDSTSFENHMTKGTTPPVVDSIVGKARNFNNPDNDFAESINLVGITGAEKRTILAVSKHDTAGSSYTLLGGHGEEGSAQLFNLLNDNSNIKLAVYGSDLDTGFNIDSDYDLWIFSYDGSQVDYYRRNQYNLNNNLALNTADSPLSIGKWSGHNASGQLWDGYIDEFWLMNNSVDFYWVNQTYSSIFGLDDVVSFGTEESLPIATIAIDLLFANDTTVYKSTFQEGEDFISYINHTTDGTAITDSVCNAVFYNISTETDYIDSNFSLCDTGCEESNILRFNIDSVDVANSVYDEIRFNLCHDNLVNRDLDITMNCSSGSDVFFIDRNSFPKCYDSGYIILNSTICKDDTALTIFLDSNAINKNNGHTIEGLEFDRWFSERQLNFTYNTTTTLYESNIEHEYYEHDIYNISAVCVNGDDSLNASTSSLITIGNIIPSIFHTIIEVSNFGNYSFINDVIVNMTDLSIVNIFTSVFDDDLVNITHLLKCTNGLLINLTTIETFTTHILVGSDFVTGLCNFTTFAIDTENDNATLKTNFTVLKSISKPIMLDVTIYPNETDTTVNLNCSATSTDDINTSFLMFFDWFLGESLISAYSTNVTAQNNTLTFTDTLMTMATSVGQEWTCRVYTWNGNQSSLYLNSSVTITAIGYDAELPVLDITTVSGGLILFSLIILYLGLMALGFGFNNFGFVAFAFLIGVIIGFIVSPIHILLTIGFFLFNVLIVFITYKYTQE